MDYKAHGWRTTDKYLVLHFTQRVGTTIRHATVKANLQDLVLSADVCNGLDRATRRNLVEHWSGVDIPKDEPLFP